MITGATFKVTVNVSVEQKWMWLEHCPRVTKTPNRRTDLWLKPLKHLEIWKKKKKRSAYLLPDRCLQGLSVLSASNTLCVSFALSCLCLSHTEPFTHTLTICPCSFPLNTVSRNYRVLSLTWPGLFSAAPTSGDKGMLQDEGAEATVVWVEPKSRGLREISKHVFRSKTVPALQRQHLCACVCVCTWVSVLQ